MSAAFIVSRPHYGVYTVSDRETCAVIGTYTANAPRTYECTAASGETATRPSRFEAGFWLMAKAETARIGREYPPVDDPEPRSPDYCLPEDEGEDPTDAEVAASNVEDEYVPAFNEANRRYVTERALLDREVAFWRKVELFGNEPEYVRGAFPGLVAQIEAAIAGGVKPPPAAQAVLDTLTPFIKPGDLSKGAGR